MPGLLNSFWLLLAAAAATHYLRTFNSGSSAGRFFRGVTLGCALALLFPVISADDDLLQQKMASDVNAVSTLIKVSANSKNYNPGSAPAQTTFVRLCLDLTASLSPSSPLPLPACKDTNARTTSDRAPPQA